MRVSGWTSLINLDATLIAELVHQHAVALHIPEVKNVLGSQRTQPAGLGAGILFGFIQFAPKVVLLVLPHSPNPKAPSKKPKPKNFTSPKSRSTKQPKPETYLRVGPLSPKP